MYLNLTELVVQEPKLLKFCKKKKRKKEKQKQNKQTNKMDWAMYANITAILYLFHCAKLAIVELGRGRG